MSNLIEIGGVVVHTDKEGRYSLNDLHKAAGAEDRHQPAYFLRRPEIVELAEEIKSAPQQTLPTNVVMGRNGGTYVCKELVYAYAMWVSAAFNLKVIRKFDEVATGKIAPTAQAIDALKLAPLAVRAARALGLDKNAATISANQFVVKHTGQNLLRDFGHTHLLAENQEAMYFTPTELGKRVNMSARGVNRRLAENGLQEKRGDVWEPTGTGKKYARIYDTGKKHDSGVPVQQIKWSAEVLALLSNQEAA